MLTYRRVHHHHAKLAERREVEAGWAQVRADPLRLGNRAEALGNAGRGGGAEPKRRRRRATSGGGQNVVDFPVLEPTGCGGETTKLQKMAVRVRLARRLRVLYPAEVHVLAAPLRAARLHARLLRDVRAVPRQRDGLDREERGRGGRGERVFRCFLETRSVGEHFVVPSLGNGGGYAGGNARVPAVLHATVATELLHGAEPRARVARCDAARVSSSESRREAREKRKQTNVFFSTILLGLPEPEPLAPLADCEHQPVAQLFLRRVLRQVQLVEARVRRAQPPALGAVRAVDLELLRPRDAL